MRYLSFSISNYRGIAGPLEIDITKKSLIPIVGVNESGKTTVLQALFAFDFFNDSSGDGRHLKEVTNLYTTSPKTASITARVAFEPGELDSAIRALMQSGEHHDPQEWANRIALGRSLWRKRHQLPDQLAVTRDLATGTYTIKEPPSVGWAGWDSDILARELLNRLPYILYFDDFKDRIEERIEIPPSADATLAGWLESLQQLFRKTDPKLSILALPGMENRQRKNVLASVQRQLDEPGSYLHAAAQTKLCKKLRKLSGDNAVVYCTHSHYLLDPTVIPFANVVVAERTGGSIGLTSVLNWRPPKGEQGAPSAFQPVLDALMIRPFALDSTYAEIAVVEGIYDFYALELFRPDDVNIGVLPCRGADRLADYVPLLLARHLPFVAMWDDDDKGRGALKAARLEFGDELAERAFMILPGRRSRSSWKLESCFNRGELATVRAGLGIPPNTSFERCIATWFYSKNREALVSQAPETAAALAAVWRGIAARLQTTPRFAVGARTFRNTPAP